MASVVSRLALPVLGGAVATCTLTTELPEPATTTGGGGMSDGSGGEHGEGGAEDAGGAGAAGGVGGLAGSGGGGGTVPVTAPDWVGSLEALFRFDQSDLTIDATGNYTDLIATGAPVFDQALFIQGQGAMRVSRTQANGLRRLAGVLPLDSYTIGGWFYVAEDTTPQDIAFIFSDAPVGYYLEREASSGEARCYHVTDTTFDNVVDAVSWRSEQWRHVVCRYDATTEQLAIYVNGTLVDIEGGVPAITYGAGELLMPDFDQPYDGSMDEVFFSDAVLPSDAILRIWACGVDGERCTCSVEDEMQYVQCGSLDDCSMLPPCNRTAP